MGIGYKKTIKKAILVFMSLLLLISLAGCGSSSTISTAKTPEENIKAIIGPDSESNNKSNQVTDIKNNNGTYTVAYNFLPVRNDDATQELGTKLSKNIKKLYDTDQRIDKITFIISSPFNDNYGNQTWKQIVSFDVDRALFKKINWDNFNDEKLLNIVENVKVLT